MITVLIVEDDRTIRMLTRAQLSPYYHILEAEDGADALEVLDHNHVDLLIVDIMMPNMNGYELVRTLREAKDTRPVIMLTAMTSFAHKREGFSSGIDDYMTKPIQYEELIWRIDALLRRARIANEKQITIGDFNMSEATHSVFFRDQEIVLTKKEFALLYKLLSCPGVVFTKQQLMDELWDYDSETDPNAIKTYISRLRSKCAMCDAFELTAIRGLGYKAVLRRMEEAE